MINYLEDYQLTEIKGLVGKSYFVPAGSPTGAGEIVKVGKTTTIFKSVVLQYCTNPQGEVGVTFTVPNRIVWNMIG